MPIPNRLIGRAIKPVNGHAMTLGGIPRIMRAKAATNKANPKVAKRIAWAVPDVGRRARYTLVIAAPRPAAKTIMPMNANAVPAVARFKLQSPSKAGMTEDVDSRRGCRYGDTGKEYCAHHRRDRDRAAAVNVTPMIVTLAPSSANAPSMAAVGASKLDGSSPLGSNVQCRGI
jgi:hypothetical protein